MSISLNIDAIVFCFEGQIAATTFTLSWPWWVNDGDIRNSSCIAMSPMTANSMRHMAVFVAGVVWRLYYTTLVLIVSLVDTSSSLFLCRWSDRPWTVTHHVSQAPCAQVLGQWQIIPAWSSDLFLHGNQFSVSPMVENSENVKRNRMYTIYHLSNALLTNGGRAISSI